MKIVDRETFLTLTLPPGTVPKDAFVSALVVFLYDTIDEVAFCTYSHEDDTFGITDHALDLTRIATALADKLPDLLTDALAMTGGEAQIALPTIIGRAFTDKSRNHPRWNDDPFDPLQIGADVGREIIEEIRRNTLHENYGGEA